MTTYLISVKVRAILLIVTSLIAMLGDVRSSGLIDAFAPGDPTAVAFGSAIKAIAVQPDGKVLVGGQFDHVGASSAGNLARLERTTGSVDETFGGYSNGIVYAIQVQTDGKIVIAGSFTRVNGVAQYALARLNHDGSYDSSLAVSVNGIAYALLIRDDGEIILGGQFNRVNGVTCNNLVRLSSTGAITSTYGAGVGRGSIHQVKALALQPNGQLLVGGYFPNVQGTTRSNLARIDTADLLDPGFTIGTNSDVLALLLLPNGGIVFGGMFSQAGGVARNFVARCNSSGVLDANFNPNVSYRVYSLASQLDGKFLVGGSFSIAGQPQKWLARFHASGALDTGFNAGCNGAVYAMRRQTNGRILVAGNFYTFDGQTRDSMARLYGFRVLDTEPRAITVNEGGSVVVDVGGVPGGTYQWTKDGITIGDSARIKGTSSSRLTFSNLADQDQGIYVCNGTASGVTQSTGDVVLTVKLRPRFETQPMTSLVTVGSKVILNVSTNESNVEYQWQKNGVSITGSNNASYEVDPAALTHAGTYTCRATNQVGSTTSVAAKLAAVEPIALAPAVAQGGSLVLTVRAAVPSGTALTYQWRRNGGNVFNGPSVSGGIISGATAQKLTITKATNSEEGNYTCLVSMDGLPAVTVTATAQVVAKPTITLNPVPPAIVSGDLTWQMASSEPVLSYSISGLPSGLSYNAGTGLITGKPKVSGNFKVKVTSRNAAGTSSAQEFTLVIATLPTGTVGSFSGLISRNDVLNNSLRGFIKLNTTSSGSITGTLTNGNVSLPFKGSMVAPIIGNPTANISIARKNLSAITITLTFTSASNDLSGNVSDGTNTATLAGKRHIWGGTSAAAYAATYNCANDVPTASLSDLAQPQGSGWQQLTVAAAGTAKVSGRTADGVAYTYAGTLWPDGSLPQFILLYSGKGSITAQPIITLGATPADHRVTGWLDQYKGSPRNASDRSYATGIPALRRTIDGSVYLNPNKDFPIVLKKPNQTGNASLLFAKGGIESAAQFSSTDQVFQLSAANKATFATTTAGNPCNVQMAVTASTGLFTGSLRLTDGATARTVSYRGILLSHRGKGYGHFALPGLTPSPSTSPILSGKVTLD